MLVPFPSSCFSFIWDCHLFLYSLSHPPRYLPQPCPGSHRFNYVLRTSMTVPVEILCMHLCRDVKYPGLVAIRSRIKCSPSSLSSTSLPHRREPYARGQSRTHFFFFPLLQIFGGQNDILIFLMKVLYSFALPSQVLQVLDSIRQSSQQWTKFSLGFSAGDGEYKMR